MNFQNPGRPQDLFYFPIKVFIVFCLLEAINFFFTFYINSDVESINYSRFMAWKVANKTFFIYHDSLEIDIYNSYRLVQIAFNNFIFTLQDFLLCNLTNLLI